MYELEVTFNIGIINYWKFDIVSELCNRCIMRDNSAHFRRCANVILMPRCQDRTWCATTLKLIILRSYSILQNNVYIRTYINIYILERIQTSACSTLNYSDIYVPMCWCVRRLELTMRSRSPKPARRIIRIYN